MPKCTKKISCDTTRECDIIRDCSTNVAHEINWFNIVGEKTLDVGGMVGDLLTVVRAHIKDAKEKGELTEKSAGEVYSTAISQSVSQALQFELAYNKANLEMCLIKAQTAEVLAATIREDCKAEHECSLKEEQTKEVIASTIREDCLAESLCDLRDKQEEEIDKKIESMSASIVRDDCIAEHDCDLKEAQHDEVLAATIREDCKAESECCLNTAKKAKMECDCANSALLANAQAELYGKQAEGFDDNARQKLYDTQIQAWSMVFADADLDDVTPSVTDDEIDSTYDAIKNNLGI